MSHDLKTPFRVCMNPFMTSHGRKKEEESSSSL